MRRLSHAITLVLLSLSLAACAGGGEVGRAEPAVEAPLVAADAAGTAETVEPAAPAEAADASGVEGAGAPPAEAAASLPPTEAEHDFAAIYGGQVYDPVADPSLPAPAALPESYDPWEPLNRRVHHFNNLVDAYVASPLAHMYVEVVPRPVRLGVRNFFSNLGQPVSAVNALLQGKPVEAGQVVARFLLNTTLGIGGIFDPASDANLPRSSEDFGQTLGKWGWRQSRYVELPLFGPRTVRDVFGMIGDAPLSPLRQVEEDTVRVFAQGLQLVDVRTQLFAVDSMREGAADDYALVRDAWLQRRDYQIAGDEQPVDESLPDYLRDDINNPTVPVDALPVLPGD